MARRPYRQGVLLACCLTLGLTLLSLPPAAAQPPVAGITPDRRPAGAPVVLAASAPAPRGLRGIAEPLPAGLGFMASQGAWYTPFTRPGMTGPYDLRGWHTAAGKP